MVVTLYAACLALWLVVLSVRVIALRGNPIFAWAAFASAYDGALNRAIRAHGNLIEYAPIFLIVLFLAESSGLSPTSLHGYGLSFLLGRIMHGVCFGFMHRNMFLRISGTTLTLIPMLSLSVTLLVRSF